MSNQTKWCFYDPETKTKTADLATDEAQMTILKMRPKDINRFYYSRSDENAWKPLKMQAVDKAVQDEIERTFTNSCISHQKTLAVDFKKPQAKTIDLVLMNSRGMIFKATALNPTPDGSWCEKEIPAQFLNSVIDVIIINSAATNKFFEKIMVHGNVVKNSSGQFIEFTFPSEALRGQLVESLNYCENHSHHIRAI